MQNPIEVNLARRHAISSSVARPTPRSRNTIRQEENLNTLRPKEKKANTVDVLLVVRETFRLGSRGRREKRMID